MMKVLARLVRHQTRRHHGEGLVECGGNETDDTAHGTAVEGDSSQPGMAPPSTPMHGLSLAWSSSVPPPWHFRCPRVFNGKCHHPLSIERRPHGVHPSKCLLVHADSSQRCCKRNEQHDSSDSPTRGWRGCAIRLWSTADTAVADIVDNIAIAIAIAVPEKGYDDFDLGLTAVTAAV